ncbi:MAG: c-type cytochrome biogenesis protein CcmI/CycH [Pseudomonadales bacterium]
MIQVNLSVQEGVTFSQDWPVFVYVSAPGSKLPLSSTRVKLSELPATVVLTEAMYVLPGMTMKGHQELVVTAKVSSSSDVHEKGPEDSYSLSPVLQFSGLEKRTIALFIKAAE